MEKLAFAREQRLNELEMDRIIKEIIFYFIFLTLIILVASHNRDTRSFQVKNGVSDIILGNRRFAKVRCNIIWNVTFIWQILVPFSSQLQLHTHVLRRMCAYAFGAPVLTFHMDVLMFHLICKVLSLPLELQFGHGSLCLIYSNFKCLKNNSLKLVTEL